jgi:hypothetical protein
VNRYQTIRTAIMTSLFKLTLLVLCALSLHSAAADPSFIVLYNSGKAAKVINGQETLLKRGDHLSAADAVNLPEKTQLTLICASYRAIELKTKGNYAVAKLLAQCEPRSTAASSAYFKYIWNQLNAPGKSATKDPRDYLAPSKGTLKATVNLDTIFYHDGALKITLKQQSLASVQVYATDADRQVLLAAQPAAYVALDSIAAAVKKPGIYFWDFQGAQSAKFNTLVILKNKQYKQLKKAILSTVVATDAAETAYLTGYSFEEKHFLADAAKYYQKALQLMPDNEVYKMAASSFTP